MKIKILLLAPVALLAACALEPKRAEPPPALLVVQPAPPSETDQILTYMMQSRKLEAREFAAEREQLKAVLQTDKSEFNRVKLALLIASAPAPLTPATAAAHLLAGASDDAELIALLEPLVNSTGASGADGSTISQNTEIRALSMLIYGIAQDRKKLRDQWRESQARVAALRRDDTKEVEARALRARVEELEAKLEALKSIDRSVNRRSEAPRTAPPK